MTDLYSSFGCSRWLRKGKTRKQDKRWSNLGEWLELWISTHLLTDARVPRGTCDDNTWYHVFRYSLRTYCNDFRAPQPTLRAPHARNHKYVRTHTYSASYHTLFLLESWYFSVHCETLKTYSEAKITFIMTFYVHWVTFLNACVNKLIVIRIIIGLMIIISTITYGFK